MLNLHDTRYISNLLNHPRMLIAAGFGIVTLFISHNFLHLREISNFVIAWNIGAIIYFIITADVILSKGDRIIERAALHDENEWVILLIATFASLSSIAAIVGELAVASHLHGVYKHLHIATAILTLMTSWAFIHLSFTLHYAHEYYSRDNWSEEPSIIFPDTREPNYLDFMYFSFVIGTSGQTADVSYGNSELRRIGLIHCVLSYIFNAAILALMINIAASLISS